MTQPHLPPDDGDLARLLGDAVRRHVEAPVDSERLVVGAQRGAARIRRRRRTGIAVLTAVVLVGVPAGLLRTGGAHPVETASSARSAPLDASASAAASAAVPAVSAASGSAEAVMPGPATSNDLRPQDAAAGAAESGTPAPPSLPPTTTPRVLASVSPSAQAVTPLSPAAALLPVPSGALLVPRDLPQITLTTTSDTANRQPAAATPTSVTCGQSLPALSAPTSAVGSRTVTYQRRSGPASTWWQLGTTVRVFPAAGAAGYLAAAHRLACAVGAPGVGDDAITSTGRPDPAGRTQYYAVVRVGRTVSEVTLSVPRGGAATGTDLRRLLAVAAGRLTSSGLAATAAADPALGG